MGFHLGVPGGLRREEATSSPSPVRPRFLQGSVKARTEQGRVQASHTSEPSPVDVAALTWGPSTRSKPQGVRRVWACKPLGQRNRMVL